MANYLGDAGLVIPEPVLIGMEADQPSYRAATAVRLRLAGIAMAAFAALVGLTVLVGYAIRSSTIVELGPSLPPMYPNAALGLLLGGLGVLGVDRSGRERVGAGIAAAVVTLIGSVGLVLHLAGANRTWYEALFPAGFVEATTPVAGRPAVETCLALVLLGLSVIAMMFRRAPLVAQALAVSAAAVGGSAVVGYLLGVDRRSLGSSVVYVGMALHTAIGITLLGLAVLLIRPFSGFMYQLLAGGMSGAMTRRLTLAIVVAPLTLSVLASLTDTVFDDKDLARSIFSVLQIGLLAALVLVPCTVAARTEQQLRMTLVTARRAAEDMIDGERIVEAVTAEMIIEVPQLPGWDVGMRYQPAFGHLAGDSVQALRRMMDDKALLVLSDLAGHDAHSAVLAYGLRVHIAALWEEGIGLPVVAARAGDKMVRRQTIATGALIEFSPEPARIDVINAGHQPPMLLRRNGRYERLHRTGPLFGIATNATYSVTSWTIERGDLLVLWTDGVEEATAPNGDQLGEQRLVSTILACRSAANPQIIADTCVDLALEHSGGRLDDDAMVIVARYRGRTNDDPTGPSS